MSNRERWILYPLLILSLALGVKAMMGPSESEFQAVKCRRLQCNEVVVVDPLTDRRIARLGIDSADQEAKLVIYDQEMKPAVTLAVAGKEQIGTLEAEALRVRHPESKKRIIELGAAGKLGQLSIYGDDDTQALVTLGAGEQGAVLRSLRQGKAHTWPAGSEAAPPKVPGKPAEKPMPPMPPEEKE